MIFTEKKITINNNQCKIDSPVVLYRGDYNVEVRFSIVSSPYKYSNKQETNVIEQTEASYGQLVIKTPGDKPAIFSDITQTKRGAITFTIAAEMIDEITEVGNYTFQIRLLDENKEGRVTIPEVVNGIEIREPIATEDVSTTNEVNVATVGYALTTAAAPEDAFDSQGNYNKTTWGAGDRITAAKLNKIEAGIDGVNNKIANINNINDTTASATTTYSSNKIENIKENLSSQINDIENYSLVKHTDGKVYIKKQDGTLVGTGVAVGGNTDLSKVTMSMEGQTLKLLNDGTQIATVEIPTATVTDEQLTAIIQSKIDDGTLAGMSLGEGSVRELNVEDGAITPNKTNFFKEEYTNLLHGLTWSNTGFSGTDKDIFGQQNWISDYAKTDKLILHTISPKMNTAYTVGSYQGKMACYSSDKTYLGLATISNVSNIAGTSQNPGHRWIEEFTLLDNTAYVRIGFSQSHGNDNYNLLADNLALTIISYNEVTIDSDPNERIFTVSENYLQSLIDAILIEKSVTSPKLSDTAIKEQFETNTNNNSIVDFPHIKFLEQKQGTENLFDYKLTTVTNNNPIDSTVNNDAYGNQALLTNMINVGDNSALCIGMCSTVETSAANQQHVISGVFCFDSTGKYLGKGTKEYVDSQTNKDENSAYVSRYLRFRISSFVENTAYVRITFSRTWINEQDILDTLIIRNSLPMFNENSKLITIKLADNYKLEGVSGGSNVTQDNGLAGKNVVWIGDSLTNWGGGSYESPGEGFLGIIYQNTGAITYNQGTAGASWEYGLGTWDETHTTYTPTADEKYTAIERVNALVANKDTFTPDYVVFMMGTNRRADGTVNDEYTNLHTMCGAIKHCILQIYNTFPNCAMGIVLPPQRNEGIEEQEQANALIKEIAEYYSVPTIDLFHEGGLLNKYRNPLTDTVNSGGFSDGLHLSDLGKNILGRKFTHWIKTL